MPIEITYQRPWMYDKQEAAVFDEHRASLIEASVKSGKTAACLAWIAEQALVHGKLGRNYWWIAPVYGQSMIAYRRMKNSLPRRIYRANESQLRITLVNGAAIEFRSAEKPDCYDSSTETLTRRGWLPFSALEPTDELLTLNADTLSAEWQLPTRIIAEPYAGMMLRVASHKVDLLVTPTHRFFVHNRRRPPRFATLDEMGHSDYIPASTDWLGKDDPALSVDRCRLMGIFLAEGCAAGCKGGTAALANGDYTVHFTQSAGRKGGAKGDVRSQLVALLTRLGYTPKETQQGAYVRNKQLWTQLKDVGNVYTKTIPQPYKDLPAAKLRELLHWMVLGDGTIRRNGQMIYYTTSPQLADDVQEIAVKSGYGARVRIKPQSPSSISERELGPFADLYQITIRKNKGYYFRSSLRSYVSPEPYDGIVYCVTVPNHVVLVRRNGKVCWSGNSLFGEDVYAAVLDEASRMREEAWHAIRSTLTATRGPVRMIGNVHGRKNWFYRLARIAEAGDTDMAYHRIDAYDAIAGGILDPEEIESAKRDFKRLGKEGLFRQLYMAEAADDGDNPFGLDAIRACCEGVEGWSTEYPAAAGVDLAGRGAQNIAPRSTSPADRDYTAIVVLDRTGHATRIERFRMPHTETTERIVRQVGHVPVLLDSTGTGDAIVETLQRRGDMQALGYTFTERSRQELLEHLALYVGEGDVHWPDEGDGAKLRVELESFEYVYSRRGVRWAVADGLHDDLALALGLAVKRMPWRRKRALLPVGIASPGGSRWTGVAGDSTAWSKYQDSLKPTTVGAHDEPAVPLPVNVGGGPGKWQ